MALPPGRKALTDDDMVILLHNVARQIGFADTTAESEMHQVADRFSELAKANKNVDALDRK